MQSRVANVYCQFDNTWNQLKHKHLATNVTNVGDFLDWIIWHGKTHPNLLVAFHINEHGRRKIYLFVCLPLLPMTSSSVLLLKYSLAGIRTDFFRIPMQTEDQQLSANPLEKKGLGEAGSPAEGSPAGLPWSSGRSQTQTSFKWTDNVANHPPRLAQFILNLPLKASQEDRWRTRQQATFHSTQDYFWRFAATYSRTNKHISQIYHC